MHDQHAASGPDSPSAPSASLTSTFAIGPTESIGSLKKRKSRQAPATASAAQSAGMREALPDEERPLLDPAQRSTTAEATAEADDGESATATRSWLRNQWVVYALASGACAAFNGVFAKLTTTELTATFSEWIARLFYLTSFEPVIEFIVRASFFGLNLFFNGVMWTLFTTALARGHSTTQVSIMNTSSNFVITAVLGFAIFSESLPPLWWLGAALLVAGNVIIGQKDESESKDTPAQSDGDFDDGASATSWGDGGVGSHRDVRSVPVIFPDEEKDEDEEGIEALLDEVDEDVAYLGDMDADEDADD